MADVHTTLSTSLTDGLIPKLRQWRKDHYEKSMIHYKITKDFEKDFLDAQKSWSKLLDRMAECKSAYYAACKGVKTAEDAERTATSEDQRKKYADKSDVARREVGFTKTKYQQIFQETGAQRPQYEQAMKNVFERTQQFEKKRLDFFKQVFEEYARRLEVPTIDK
jgi:protein kinase C and casein kinase substrate in neurons protein